VPVPTDHGASRMQSVTYITASHHFGQAETEN
jgi:hypothetical protein